MERPSPPPCLAAPAMPGRRQLLRAAAALGGCVAAWPRLARAGLPAVRLREARDLMGTRVDIAAQGEEAASLRPAVEAAFARMAELAAVMSHYEPTSRVSAIGLAAGLQPVPISKELLTVLEMAQSVSRRSAGAFDVTVGTVGQWHFGPDHPQMPAPAHISSRLSSVGYSHLELDARAGRAYLSRRGMRLDLGGIAKLYILQAGMEVLRAHGLNTALINGGGDVVAMGADATPPWRVGVRDPRAPERLLGVVALRRGFVASSGDYERCFVRDGRRYHHVLDPKTGYPTQGPHGVTLVGESLEAVNGIGAAAMVLGRDAPPLIRWAGVEALIAHRDGSLWMTPRMRSQLQPPA
ncbi:FAD:protein FMN transferase [Azohydromonas caseinilytica]|uniref:FAD:protein FMN transferase n=1 Tax=Azohydromonas caseinilytica TaxID=2728836 RepID=A0A848F467_9BURK|nr:FAD:protein FMN transferase [Azohydromonas caseinilytica]NML14434.1 FAD:protein FMN transferase [Azohydromonas caseinilytica]